MLVTILTVKPFALESATSDIPATGTRANSTIARKTFLHIWIFPLKQYIWGRDAIGSWLLAVGFWAEQNQNQHLPRRPTTAGLQPTTAGLQHGGTESHGEKMGENNVKSKIKSRKRPRTLRHARKLIFLRFWYEQRLRPY